MPSIITPLTRFVLFFCIVLATACQDDTLSRSGFDTLIEPTSHGSVTLDVNKEEKTLLLTGTITVSTGNVALHVTSPQGDTAYTDTIGAVRTAHIDQTFDAIEGAWSLSYQSLQGTGALNVHLQSEH
jgi:hypothetical protein